MKLNYLRDPLFLFKNLFAFSNNNALYNWIRNGEEGWLLSRSTWSIVLIILLKLRTKKNLSIWFPSYYCREVIDIINELDVNIVFYNVNDLIEPSVNDFKILLKTDTPDILILVHNYPNYSKIKDITSLFDLSETWIIEDATQCFIPASNIGLIGHFILYSPYKFLPIFSGAILILTEKAKKINLDKQLFKEITKEIELRYSKFFYSKYNHYLYYLKLFLKSILSTLKLLPISFDSFEISDIKTCKLQNPRINSLDKLFFKISTIELENLVKKRRSNLSEIKAALSNFEKEKILHTKFLKKVCYDLLDDKFLPISFPICINRFDDAKNIYNKFQQLGIQVNSWPDLPKQIIDNQYYISAINLRLSIIHFPIHQSISLSRKTLKFLFKHAIKK